MFGSKLWSFFTSALILSWMFLYSSASVSNTVLAFSLPCAKGGNGSKDAYPSELVKSIQLPVCFSTPHCRPRSINSPMRQILCQHQIELHLAERWCHLFFTTFTLVHCQQPPAHSTPDFICSLFEYLSEQKHKISMHFHLL